MRSRRPKDGGKSKPWHGDKKVACPVAGCSMRRPARFIVCFLCHERLRDIVSSKVAHRIQKDWARMYQDEEDPGVTPSGQPDCTLARLIRAQATRALEGHDQDQDQEAAA